MHDRDAQVVLLVRALEEADAEGRLLPSAQRARATSAAREAWGDGSGDEVDEEALLVHRADVLMLDVERQVPRLSRLLGADRLGGSLASLVLLGALLVGAAGNALGPARQIQVLFAPMLGLVAWNLVVYLLLLVVSLKRAAKSNSTGDAPRLREAAGRHSVTGVVGGLASRFVQRHFRRALAEQAEQQALVTAAASGFARLWGAASTALMACRLTRLLHLASLLLAAGAIGGMYVRGLGLEYRASWESTFLTAEQVQSVLQSLLGPSAWLLGTVVPEVAPLEAPADGLAAPWIHLWATTVVLFIVLPRLALWCLDGVRVRRLSRSVQLDLGATYFRSLLVPVRGDASSVDVFPYGARLDARARETLMELMHDVQGARAEVRVHDTLTYGDEAAGIALNEGALNQGAGVDSAQARRSAVVVFGLAQSPESEVHGEFVRELTERLQALDTPWGLAVLIENSSYRRRMSEPRRLEERQRAWDRVLRDVGQQAVHVDLGREGLEGREQSLPPDVMNRLAELMRPATPEAAR